jgi:hypothetical protein
MTLCWEQPFYTINSLAVRKQVPSFKERIIHVKILPHPNFSFPSSSSSSSSWEFQHQFTLKRVVSLAYMSGE